MQTRPKNARRQNTRRQNTRRQNAGVRSGRGDLLGMLAAAPVEPMRVGGIITLVTAILAVRSVEAGLLPYAPRAASLGGPDAAADPVLVRVDGDAVRLSDLRAQAGAAGTAASADALVRQGYLSDAAQQLVLAHAAEADGLASTLEVRAALALARRRVLSEAYLDLAVSRAVTDEAVSAAYEAEVAGARAHDRVALRHVLAATEQGARSVLRRAERGERLATLAARLSQDPATRERGGSLGMIHPDALPEGLRAVARTAPLGALVGPVRTPAGWHVVRVDARRQLAVPPLAARAPVIREALRAQALREAAARATAAARIEAGPVPVDEVAVLAAGAEPASGPAPAPPPSASPSPPVSPLPSGGTAARDAP